MVNDTLKVLSYTQAVEVLNLLKEKEGCSFTEVSNELKLNPNIVNRRLKELREQEMVEKEGRKYVATQKGKNALKIVSKIGEL